MLGALHVALASRSLGEMTRYFHVGPSSVSVKSIGVMAVYRPLVRALLVVNPRSAIRRSANATDPVARVVLVRTRTKTSDATAADGH